MKSAASEQFYSTQRLSLLGSPAQIKNNQRQADEEDWQSAVQKVAMMTVVEIATGGNTDRNQ